MQYYHMDGIDLDYENPYMSKAQSRSFLKLVQKLDSKLTANQFITVTILSNPQYITGSETAEQIGFDNQVLKEISTLSHVKLINLMTYDFHGAFDYQSDGSGKTGFLTNLYMPNNAPDGYDPRFSVQTAVEAMQSAGVPNSKIGIGIPAYGRSLANIDKGSAEAEGLFQPITNAALVPGGDLDSAGCDETITHADNTKPVCTGTFTYGYITSKMLSNGFLAKDWQNDSGNQYNGTTAYATSWSPAGTSYNHKLEIKNTGNGIGFQVSIAHDSNQFSSDWLNPGVDKVYDTSTNPDTTTIEGIDHLSVSASTWNKTYTCAQTFDFNKDYQVILKVDAAGNFSCELQPA
jgi:GH18 family chitinase